MAPPPPLPLLQSLLLVALGGALGSAGRYAVAAALVQKVPEDALIATLAVNAVGSFLLGWLAGRPGTTEAVRLLVGVGGLGGLTTYSSFNAQVVGAIEAGRWALGTTYLVGTVGLCLVAGVLGMAAARSGA